MKYYRGALVILSFFLFFCGAVIISFSIFPLIKLFVPKENQKKYFAGVIHKSWEFFLCFIQKIKIIKINAGDISELKGIKNKIIVSTHPSFIDVIILAALIPDSVCFAKKELVDNFILGNIIRNICISSGLELDEMKTLTKDYLDRGFNIIIFPSGIRHKKDESPKIRKGASIIALNAGKNIVPIRMYTDYDFLQIGQPVYDAGAKTINYFIEVLPEINIQNFKTEDEVNNHKIITRVISESLYDGEHC